MSSRTHKSARQCFHSGGKDHKEKGEAPDKKKEYKTMEPATERYQRHTGQTEMNKDGDKTNANEDTRNQQLIRNHVTLI